MIKFKQQLLLPRKYSYSEIRSGSGNAMEYFIPGFLVLRDVYVARYGRVFKKGEGFWMTASCMYRYAWACKPDDYQGEFNFTQYYYDKVILGIPNEAYRPRCRNGCGRSAVFWKISAGYSMYCSDECAHAPENESHNRQANTLSNVWADPDSAYNSKEFRQYLSDQRYRLWADPNSSFNSEEYRQLRSQIMKDAWARPDSGYHDLQYSETKREIMVNLWKDPNSVFNSERFRNLLSENDRKRWADPNDTFNSVNHRKNLSEITSRNWADPTSGYNTPEYRKMLSDRFKAMWADPTSVVNSVEYRNYLSERNKYVWTHPEEYPYFHETMNKLFEAGGGAGIAMKLYPGWVPGGGKYKYDSGAILTKKAKYVKYMSSYELRFIELLEDDPDVITYISQPLGISYMRLDGSIHKYYPDFLVEYSDGSHALIEVKPYDLVDTELNKLKFAVGEAYAYKHGWNWSVITEYELWPE